MLKRNRKRMVTALQLDILWEYLNSNREIANAFNRTLESKEYAKRWWSEVAATLNSQGNGPRKEWNEWSKYWVDFKAKLKKRVNDLHLAANGGEVSFESLSEIDKKFLQIIIGDDYVNGLPKIINVKSYTDDSHTLNEDNSGTMSSDSIINKQLKKETDVIANKVECSDKTVKAWVTTDTPKIRAILLNCNRKRTLNTGVSEVNETRKKSMKISQDNVLNEFDVFCESLAIQLKKMPLNRALVCQEKLQNVMTQERLLQLKQSLRPPCSSSNESTDDGES